MSNLTIKQVSHLTGIPTHTLRFWEKEFDGILVPLRTQGGQRRYNSESISLIESIKHFKDRGLSLSMIHQRIVGGSETSEYDYNRIEVFAKKVSGLIKNEIYNFLENEKK